MASIQERDGKFRVQIRKRGIDLCATFSDRQTAELWSLYKEDLIDEIDEFTPALQTMITLEQAIDLKADAMRKEDKDTRSINDIIAVASWFNEYLDQPISTLTYDLLMTKALEMLNGTVFRGGNIKGGKGHERKPSIATVERKFKVLSTIFSNLITKGVAIENNALKVGQYLAKQKVEK